MWAPDWVSTIADRLLKMGHKQDVNWKEELGLGWVSLEINSARVVGLCKIFRMVF